MKEMETSSPTPEQLLQILDARIAISRANRKNSERNRAVFLTVGILLVLVGATAAFMVLSYMVQTMPERSHSVDSVAQP